jgi:signal transduction histidine kinase
MRLLHLGLAAAGVALGVVAYQVQIAELGRFTSPERAVAVIAVAWAFLVAGLAAWSRRPDNRMGPLLFAAGFALLVRQLRYSHDAALFTIFFLVSEVSYALVAHSVLAYPSGRVTDRFERLLVKVGYAATLLFPLAILLFYDASEPLRFFDPSPRESLLLLWENGEAALLIQKTFIVFVWGVLAVLFIALLIRKLARTTSRGRRLLAPLVLAAVVFALRAVFEGIFTFIDRPSVIVIDYLFWWQVAGFIALPLALLAGLLQARLARANVGDLILELERTPPQGVRDALARALGDPSLEIVFWLPERAEFVDVSGAAVDLPAKGAERAVTRLEHEGVPVAALLHDPTLLDEPELVRAAGAAASLAIENARLHADMRAQLSKVQESRVRIVEAADEERRRIERDLHDGAQQRLVALALQLRSAQRQFGSAADPEIDRLLEASVDELQAAVEDLRELARGVHPAILTEEGLEPALESLTSRTPLPISLEVSGEGLSAPVQATAYFVVCEALANVVKHSGASKVRVSAGRRNGLFVVEVEDNGIGGAYPEGGSGLRGLADRVEALGGRLLIDSPPQQGTRIVGEIPCGS